MNNPNSEIDLKIGCDGTQTAQHYHSLDVKILFKQTKINEYNKAIQRQLNVKRTPIFSLQFPNHDTFKTPTQLSLFGYQFDIKQKIIANKRLLWGDLKSQQQLLYFKKIQRVLHLLTQLHTQANFKCFLYKISEKINKQNISLNEVLDRAKIGGTIKIDQKTIETLKKCLIKVSPKFVESPIFIFLQMFLALDLKLQIQNFDFLEKQSQDHLLSTLFQLKDHNRQLFQTLKKGGKDSAKLIFCLQKLISLQISGSCELLALICKFL